eukprot:14916547-Ditylum_brightwellii.AAC.1
MKQSGAQRNLAVTKIRTSGSDSVNQTPCLNMPGATGGTHNLLRKTSKGLLELLNSSYLTTSIAV